MDGKKEAFDIALLERCYVNTGNTSLQEQERILSLEQDRATALIEESYGAFDISNYRNAYEKMMEAMREERPDLSFPKFRDDKIKADIAVTYCPERVLPGQVVRELVENDRTIGGVTTRCAEQARELYKIFVKADCLITDCRTAELSKLVENSFRDVNVAFANELSLICDKLDINVWELIKFSNRHPRVNILQPGTGVGGHCIAVDPWFIVSAFQKEAVIIRNAREINNYKTEWVIEKIKSTAFRFELDNNRKPTIALMGLAFKPDIDDLRESPALLVADTLLADGKFDLLLVEPNLEESNKYDLTDYEELNGKADIIIYLVAHKEFIGFKTKSIELDFCGINN